MAATGAGTAEDGDVLTLSAAGRAWRTLLLLVLGAMFLLGSTVGQDDWTTLADLNGHTSSDLSTDQSCTGGWSNLADTANVLHPFLTHYQTFDPATGTCSATGTSGEWSGVSGRFSTIATAWRMAASDASSCSRSVCTSISRWLIATARSIAGCTCCPSSRIPRSPDRERAAASSRSFSWNC